MTSLTDKHAIFQAWAPGSCPWSPWAKPVTFAHLPRPLPALDPVLVPDLGWRDWMTGDCAIVVDLPGPVSVETGLVLQSLGGWPVPLFNACPAPIDPAATVICAVEVDAILAALVAGADRLAGKAPAAKPVPVFLLDSHRISPLRPVQREMFDNRSVVFASDFPSAALLRQHGIHRALIVHDAALPLGSDLRHALTYWRKHGLAISAIASDAQPLDIDWPATGFWGTLQQRMFALFTLRRNPLGGYGGFVPEASGG